MRYWCDIKVVSHYSEREPLIHPDISGGEDGVPDLSDED